MAKTSDDGGGIIETATIQGAKLKERLQRGELILGGIVMEVLRPLVAKMYHHAGYDFIFMDNEHVLSSGLPSMADFLIAARDNHLPVIAKIPELGRAETGRLLEAGVVGIQLPRTESREQLETLADFMMFPPVGTRAAAPIFGNTDYGPVGDVGAWLEEANRSMIIVAHIETRKGLENFDTIVTAPHLDMVYVGPMDFSVSMGHPGDYDHPDVAEGIDHILKTCLKHEIPVGTTASGVQSAAAWVKRGVRFFEVMDELTLIRQGSADTVAAYRRDCVV